MNNSIFMMRDCKDSRLSERFWHDFGDSKNFRDIIIRIEIPETEVWFQRFRYHSEDSGRSSDIWMIFQIYKIPRLFLIIFQDSKSISKITKNRDFRNSE